MGTIQLDKSNILEEMAVHRNQPELNKRFKGTGDARSSLAKIIRENRKVRDDTRLAAKEFNFPEANQYANFHDNQSREISHNGLYSPEKRDTFIKGPRLATSARL